MESSSLDQFNKIERENMEDYIKLANVIFPNITKTIDDLEKEYPSRNLPSNAEVTRFAPSPTGFLHTGSLFTVLVAKKVADQSKGVFYTRLEDTDTKREVEGSGEELLEQLKVFNVAPNEGYLGNHEEGIYGPYKQSLRADIYKVVIKDLLMRGRAYPCFCSQDELKTLREEQEKNKVIPGYYGKYAKCRNLTVDEAIKRIENGNPYVIRFKSLGDHENKIEVHDEIRGDLSLSQNDQDIVIYKSDGLPTYHFAHLVDDHFMHTTIVTRGEEWLPSLPIHLELFESMNWKAPKYAHLPVIMKLDNGNKRKLSKRKDSEAAISYFLEDGYPVSAVKEYLYTIANSNYEEWRMEHPDASYDEFTFSFDKMSLDGALFDLEKLRNISKELIGKYSKDEMTEEMKKYTKVYDRNFYELILKDEEYFTKIMDIEKDKPNPRKDYVTYSEVFSKIKFMYEPYYTELMTASPLPFNPNFDKELIKNILLEFVDTLDLNNDEQTWFSSLKTLANKYGFANNMKEFKKNPTSYIGQVGDVAEMVRISLTSSKQSPNIYYILKILGIDEIRRRINFAISLLN